MNLQEVLAEVSKGHPHRLAVRGPEQTYSYQELLDRSSSIAGVLLDSGREEGEIVALLLAHDAPSVAAILGVIFAGCTCLCLDPRSPPAHSRRLMAHSRAAAVVTDRERSGLAGELGEHPRLILEDLASSGPARRASSSESPFFLRYTSGTSGEPRGILEPRETALLHARTYMELARLTPEDRLSLLAHCSVSASNVHFYSSLLAGASLMLFEPGRNSVDALIGWLEVSRITVLHTVPTLYTRIAQRLPDPSRLSHLRLVKLGGEPVSRAVLRIHEERLPGGCQMVNGLGLTEACGNVTYFLASAAHELPGVLLPVGRAAKGFDLHVVDEDGKKLAPGETGELVIRSPYLGIPYRREISGAHQQAPAPGELATGDLAVELADHLFVHLGRLDHRLTVRGQTFHPAEVEAQLSRHQGVAEAALVVERDEADESHLVAAVVLADGSHAVPASDLRRHLAAHLPAWQIPSSFVSVPRLPRRQEGKLHRGALAAVVRDGGKLPESPGTLPEDDLQLRLLNIWEQALGARDLGIDHDFFDIGGDSLAAAQVATAVHRELGLELPLTDLEVHRTVRRLAVALREGGEEPSSSSVVLLGSGGHGRPVFGAPGAGSDVISLLALARLLGPGRPFYGLQTRGLNGSEPLPETVEELASYVLREIEDRGFEPPFHLLGSSFGGLLAFEMAGQLSARGSSVGAVILLDTYGPGFPRVRRGLSPWKRLRLLARWLRPIGLKHHRSFWALWRGIVERGERGRTLWELSKLRRGGPRPYSRRFLFVREACFRASARYRPEPYSGRVHLFRAQTGLPPDLYQEDPYLGWQGLAAGGVELHNTPGRHGSHIQEPHVTVLAEALDRVLERADGEYDGWPGGSDHTRPPKGRDETRGAWEKVARWWDERLGEDGTPWQENLLTPVADGLLAPAPGQAVLDIACGNGAYARHLAGQGVRVVAFDFSPEIVTRARSRGFPPPGQIHYSVIDATDETQLLSLEPGVFDAAVCLLGMQSMPVLVPLLSTLPRFLKPQARFVFSVPYPEGDLPADRGDLAGEPEILPLSTRVLPGQPEPVDYFFRPPGMLERLAERYGFRVLEVVEVQQEDLPAEQRSSDWTSQGTRYLTFLATLQDPGSPESP